MELMEMEYLSLFDLEHIAAFHWTRVNLCMFLL